jgi:hypothetical protein
MKPVFALDIARLFRKEVLRAALAATDAGLAADAVMGGADLHCR